MSDSDMWEKFFDAHAPIYNDNCFTKNTTAEVDFLIEELQIAPGSSVLDVGCGTGRHSVELAKRGYKVTGIDLSAGMLDQAKKAAKEAGVSVRWIKSDASSFSLEAEFDAAICLCEGAFGLLGGEDDALSQPLAILRNVSAALKGGGKCLFTVLNGLAMIRRHSQEDVGTGVFNPLSLSEVSVPVPGHPPLKVRERGFVPTELQLMFDLAGMKVLNIWGGTAGGWKREQINLDEMEIMVVGQKAANQSLRSKPTA